MKNRIRLIFIDASGQYWIGATDEQVEGEWRWRSDNSIFSLGALITANCTVFWRPLGEPSAALGENCARITMIESGVMKDQICTTLFLYICEYRSMYSRLSNEPIKLSAIPKRSSSFLNEQEKFRNAKQGFTNIMFLFSNCMLINIGQYNIESI